ncbi:hypothetical protein BN80_203 [Yersinia phage phiR1-RT]|uniref:Uncharacterized protein n=2 Tax=Tegunavirus TaxID=1921704 RepID=A0A0B5A2W0_9CAUD|nr:hypothetical protein BN80_203 [Yersinia phage phiR1-RT]YP_009200456.1 hypothetical protein AVV33_gp200 [Yersinia phage vB_YenM_TG1]AJD82005.1 hypothetical protein YenMTG1_195 [Yersinia phage vB_YenM_TG1]CCI88773.1 hypothetical protein BN80_203 [Yersinia phage phiR1-RT]
MAILRFKCQEWKTESRVVDEEFNTLLEIVMKEYFPAASISLDLVEQFKPKTEVEINNIFVGRANGVLAVNVFWHDDKNNIIHQDLAFVGH